MPHARGELPSGRAAADFVEGKPGSLGPLVVTTGARAGIAALGLVVAGAPKDKIFGYAVAVAVAIELFVLAHVSKSRQDARQPLDLAG